MSVLCGRIANMALILAARHQSALLHQPTILINRADEICGLSTPAYQAGVRMGMSARQAQMRCPGLTIVAADWAVCRSAQDAFVAELSAWELPVETHGMGMAYIDLHTLTSHKKEVVGLAAELGHRLRRVLGDDLVPSLGWDHSKFCARAAAYQTQAGRMKLVAKEDEVAFLAPLPIHLLPLPALDLQRLRWLGITTVGQYAALPTGAVRQQFGRAGEFAQRWAQGRDNRPVRDTRQVTWSPLEVEFATPTASLPAVTGSLLAALQPHLAVWAAELRGCTRLRLELCFVNHERRALGLDWIEPVTHSAGLSLHISNQLAALNWPGELDRLVITEVQTGELPSMQLSLFEAPVVETVELVEVVAALKARYGPIFLQRQVVDASHPAYERRVQKIVL